MDKPSEKPYPIVRDPASLKRRVGQRRDLYRRFEQWARRRHLPLAPFLRTARAVEKAIDCTRCASCCATMRVPINQSDIRRIAKHLKLTVSAFTARYLKYDKEDKEYEIKAEPCPFLRKDKRCGIYSVRPRGCRDYPFISRQRDPVADRVDWLIEHADGCPIIYNTVEIVRKAYYRPRGNRRFAV